MNSIIKNNTNIQYRQVGDFNISNLSLPPEEIKIRLGKWGLLHKDYLLKNNKVLFTTLIAEGKLWQHLSDIDIQAQQMFDTLVEQMKQKENITEQLKEENQVEWITQINSTQAQTQEVVCAKLIYD